MKSSGVRVLKGGHLIITIVLLLTMILSVEGWQLFVTPISALGVIPRTSVFFPYFITFQTLVMGVLYRRKKVKPFLSFVGLASLFLICIYDMYSFRDLHNFFAVLFFAIQPIIFFVEYRRKKDVYALTKFAVLVFLILLGFLGIIPLPIFEFISYSLLILFL